MPARHSAVGARGSAAVAGVLCEENTAPDSWRSRASCAGVFGGCRAVRRRRPSGWACEQEFRGSGICQQRAALASAKAGRSTAGGAGGAGGSIRPRLGSGMSPLRVLRRCRLNALCRAGFGESSHSRSTKSSIPRPRALMSPIASRLLSARLDRRRASDGRGVAFAAHHALSPIPVALMARPPCTRRSTSGATVPDSNRLPPPACP